MYFKRIQDLRDDAGLTQAQVARMLICNRDVYRRYEKGINEIPVWALIKLAELYNVSIDYIVERTNDKSYKKEVTKTIRPLIID